jgi:hypothetical protein
MEMGFSLSMDIEALIGLKGLNKKINSEKRWETICALCEKKRYESKNNIGSKTTPKIP